MATKKREGLKKKTTNNHIWEIIEDIKTHKKGNLLDDPRYEKDFNQFLVLRALAMDEELTELANFVNQFLGFITNKQMYNLLIKLIPQTDKRCQWIKNEKEDNKDIDAIMNYFNCNRREAVFYYKTNDKKWLEEIKREIGGLKK